mmetsp:Transcript_28657/g.66541  ORF Transcript_28657/g.66541 Transcript_28657/m.66541 type:complete len:241 (-) Transcript_28657:848-1570(-)
MPTRRRVHVVLHLAHIALGKLEAGQRVRARLSLGDRATEPEVARVRAGTARQVHACCEAATVHLYAARVACRDHVRRDLLALDAHIDHRREASGRRADEIARDRRARARRREVVDVYRRLDEVTRDAGREVAVDVLVLVLHITHHALVVLPNDCVGRAHLDVDDHIAFVHLGLAPTVKELGQRVLVDLDRLVRRALVLTAAPDLAEEVLHLHLSEVAVDPFQDPSVEAMGSHVSLGVRKR